MSNRVESMFDKPETTLKIARENPKESAWLNDINASNLSKLAFFLN